MSEHVTNVPSQGCCIQIADIYCLDIVTATAADMCE